MKLQEWATQVNLKCSTISLDPMYNIQSNSAANLEAEAVHATPTVRQPANLCTSILWTASLLCRQAGKMWELQQIDTCIWLAPCRRFVLLLWPGADSTMDKLLRDGQEKESSPYYLLPTFWDWGWGKDAGHALSEGKYRNKKDFKTPGLLQQQKRKRSYGGKHCHETYGMFAGS